MTIQQLRRMNNYTQRDLAKILEVSQTAIYKWELRETKFNKKVKDKIKEKFGYSKLDGTMTSYDLGTRT